MFKGFMILLAGVSRDYNPCLGDDDNNDRDQDQNEHDEKDHDHDKMNKLCW